MRKESGIPRPFQPNDQAQELRDLKRKVAQLEARRNFVSVERIVEGGTLNENVGKQITDTVQETIVIDGGNLGEGALDGQRMVGAIIETNGAANRGVKIDDTGFRGYDADGNRYMKADETGLEMTGSIATVGQTEEANPRPIAARLTTVSRPDVSGWGIPTPGLVFTLDGTEVTESSSSVYCPDGRGLVLSTKGEDGADGSVYINSESMLLASRYIALGSSVTNATLVVNSETDTVNIGFPNLFGNPPDTKINLHGDVRVNGRALTDSGWRAASYLNGWMDYGNGFGGLQYRVANNILYVRGTIRGGAVNSIVANLPTGFRPTVQQGTQATEFPITARQGTTWYSGTMYAYANGDLRYDAPPGAWSGADRVIINAASPL